MVSAVKISLYSMHRLRAPGKMLHSVPVRLPAASTSINTMKFFFLSLIAGLPLFLGAQPRRIVVAQDGSGDYATVQAAFDAVPPNNTKPVLIFVKRGVYKEKLHLDAGRDFDTLEGADPGTVL